MLRRLGELLGLRAFSTAPRLEEWRFDPRTGSLEGEQPFDVASHPLRCPRVVLCLPGWNGSIDGYEGKYAKLAALLVARGVGAVVRTSNAVVPYHPFETTCVTRLRALAAGVARDARAICGHPDPELYLLGFSAGASAMAALAPELPRVTRALLIAPSADAGYEEVAAGLRRYAGELCIVVGDQDEVVARLPQELHALATTGARSELVVIEGCDHQFRGERNGRVLSQAPLWAFADDRPFPDPARGVPLYGDPPT